MLYRIVDLPYCPTLGRIDDEPLQRLLHGHEVLASTERFYAHDGTPHLVVSVRYRLATLGGDRSCRRSGDLQAEGTREPWRSEMDPEAWALFEKLRAWRTARARADAVPPYVVLTNQQLSEVVRLRPRTVQALGQVHGLGRGRLERFGRELIDVIATGVVPRGPQEDPEAKRAKAKEDGEP